jgi:hypothetical protein
MNDGKPEQPFATPPARKHSTTWFWVAFLFPAVLGLGGYGVGALLGLNTSSAPVNSPLQALVIVWALCLEGAILVCSLYCALFLARKLRTGVAKILGGLFFFLLFLFTNIVIEVATCSMFVTVNFH